MSNSIYIFIIYLDVSTNFHVYMALLSYSFPQPLKLFKSLPPVGNPKDESKDSSNVGLKDIELFASQAVIGSLLSLSVHQPHFPHNILAIFKLNHFFQKTDVIYFPSVF